MRSPVIMSDSDLRSKVIRLAHENPSLRPHLLPLLKSAEDERQADAGFASSEIRAKYELVMDHLQNLGALIEMEDARAMPVARRALQRMEELNEALRSGGVTYRRATE